MTLNKITTPLHEPERHAAERAIAKASDTAEERIRNRRALARTLAGRVAEAIDAMAYEGLPFDQAAEHAGVRPANLRRALANPVAKKYLAELERQVRSAFRLQALHRTNELARTAHSEQVRLGANKALLLNPDLKAPLPSLNLHLGGAIGPGEVIAPGIVIDLTPDVDDRGGQPARQTSRR